MNAHSQPPPPVEKLAIGAFFRWAETQDRKYELVDGTPRLQPWVKRSHSLIVGNIDFALRSRLDRAAYSVHQGDFAIPTGPGSVRYADVLVEPAGAPLDERTADQAILIIEVLSESTMHVDFGLKRNEYFSLSSVDTYIVVAQDIRRIWQWTRGDDREWPDEPNQIAESDVRLAKLAVTLTLDEIYAGVI